MQKNFATYESCNLWAIIALSTASRGKSLATNIFRIVDRLHCTLVSSKNSHMTSGCFEALFSLSLAYPPIQIPIAWGCQVPKAIKKLPINSYVTKSGEFNTMQTSLYNRTDVKTFSTHPSYNVFINFSSHQDIKMYI